MEKDMKNKSAAEQADSNNTLQNLSGLQMVEFGDSTGFACDVDTGICGPVDQKEENEK